MEWTGGGASPAPRKVADYLSKLIGEPISRQQGWEYLKLLRLRLRVPRPEHQEANPEE